MGRMAPFAAFVMTAALCLVAASCGDDPGGPKVVATEVWAVDIGSGQGGGEFTFIRQSNGAVTAVGEFVFGEILCPFSSGPGAVSDSTISFMATGIATKNTVSSAFTLTVDGRAGGGAASGTYSIVFAEGWTTGAPPDWFATRTSGSGITP